MDGGVIGRGGSRGGRKRGGGDMENNERGWEGKRE